MLAPAEVESFCFSGKQHPSQVLSTKTKYINIQCAWLQTSSMFNVSHRGIAAQKTWSTNTLDAGSDWLTLFTFSCQQNTSGHSSEAMPNSHTQTWPCHLSALPAPTPVKYKHFQFPDNVWLTHSTLLRRKKKTSQEILKTGSGTGSTGDSGSLRHSFCEKMIS